MIGVLYYIYFLILGFLYSKYLFNKNIYYHIWVGGVIGNALLMVGAIIPSFIFGFTIISHIVLLILVTIPLVILIKKNGLIIKCKKSSKDEMTSKIFLLLVVPIFILIAVLLTNHILVPTGSGGLATGQSTYGDLNLHLGIITSISEQQVFPPKFNLLSNTNLNYPFLVDSLSSSLHIFGSSLRLAILLPSYVICLLLIMGFYYLAYKITNNKKASILSTAFFFLGGGFGFAYFLDGAKSNISLFTRIFSDYYHTPTNFNEMNIRWANPICDMIVPQRVSMAGWFMMMPCLCLLIEGCRKNERKTYIMLGLLASCLPMISAHSFLALGIISIGMFILYFINNNAKKEMFTNWFIYGVIVILLAFPQLFLWTFQQTIGNSGFIKFHFNWVNDADPYIWFYIKNWGLVTIFIIPAFFAANKDNRKLILSSALILIMAELFVFQPNFYDNNKLLFIPYMIFLIVCSSCYVYILDLIKNKKIKYYFLVLIIVLSTLSGVLTIGREINSGGMYETFNKDMVDIAEYIKNNTNKDALFLTSTSHINPVTSLAGRNTYVGGALYLPFHGFLDELNRREDEIKRAYGGTYEEMTDFCNQHNISYIYVGVYEKNNYDINEEMFNKLSKLISFGQEELYTINKM